MHYIRFLKVPRIVDKGNGRRTLDAKITVTTDLGEAFLTSDIAVLACLVDPTMKGPEYKSWSFGWRGSEGMRALEISLDLPNRRQELGMYIRFHRTKHGDASASKFREILSGERSIVPVYSATMDIKPEKTGGSVAKFAERRFYTETELNETASQIISYSKTGLNAKPLQISIWEETGESIARHIWDAGLVLSAYISQIAPHLLQDSSDIPASVPRLPSLESLLRKQNLNILELGAGCGIVGLTLSHSLSPNISKIILTDLPEATEILERNLAPFESSVSDTTHTISHQVLDWSSPTLPPNISSTSWDLIVVADCTYNPDVVPDLVSTLGKLREGNKDVLVLLAMKVRHESEKVFFELMNSNGWEVREKAVLGLGMLGGGEEEEGEEIEIYVFGGKEEGARAKRRKVG